MKQNKSFAVQKILLGGLLTASVCAFAEDSVLQDQAWASFQHKSAANIKSIGKMNPDYFDLLLEQIKSNQYSSIDIEAYMFSSEEMVQLIKAIKTNTSIKSFMYSQGNFIGLDYGVDEKVVAALVDLFKTRKNMHEVVFDASHDYFEIESLKQITTAINSNPDIKILQMWGWTTDESNMKVMADFIINTQLDKLYLDFESVTTEYTCDESCKSGARIFANALEKSNLKGIQLSGPGMFASQFDCNLTDIFLAAIKANTSLQSIDLVALPFSKESLASFGEFIQTSKNLKELSLHANLLDDDLLLSLLPILQSNNSITSFYLGSQIYQANTTLTELMNLYANKNFEKFRLRGDFSSPTFSIENMQILSNKLAHDKTLRILEMDFCNFKSQEAVLIADALRTNNTLKELSLHAVNIGIEGARALVSSLEDNHSLIRMDINMGLLTQEEQEYATRRLEENGRSLQ